MANEAVVIVPTVQATGEYQIESSARHQCSPSPTQMAYPEEEDIAEVDGREDVCARTELQPSDEVKVVMFDTGHH